MNKPTKLQKRNDIFYALGNFSGGLVSYVMGSWYMYFYVDHLGLATKYYSIAMVIYGIWNAINDPIMGIVSDKTKSRWGRRKPYMLFGAVPLGLALVLMFSPPEAVLATQEGLFFFFVLTLCIFDTFFTMTMLAWSAVLPEMYADEANRARVSVYSQIFGVLGAMIATVAVQPMVNAMGYSMMSWVFGIIGIITMILSGIGAREEHENMEAGALGVVESFKATFTNKAFLICVTSVLLVEIGKVICTSTIAFYSTYVMHNDLGVTIIMGALFISSMIFAPLVSRICSRWGAKNTYIITTAIFATAGLGFLFAPNIIVAAAVAAIAGIGVSGIMIMPNLLYAEIIDDDQRRTGVRREGAFFGMNALVMRLSVVVQGFASDLVLDNCGYVAQAAQQTAEAVKGIRILMGLIPLVFVVLAVIVLFFYPLDSRKQAGNQV